MTVTFMAMYPDETDSNFDLDYYINDHIPLVKKLWGSSLLSVRVIKGVSNTESSPMYQIIAILEVDSIDNLHQLIAKHGPELGADFPNYSRVKPTIQISENIL